MDDGSDSSEDDIGWQVVASKITGKRRRSVSPKLINGKRQNFDNKNLTSIKNVNNNNAYTSPFNVNKFTIMNNNDAGTSKQTNTNIPGSQNNNRFASLDDEEINTEDEEYNENSNNNEPKPPPIFIPFVADISAMVKCFSKIIPSSEFQYKSLKDGQIRLLIKNVKSYRIIVTHLNDKKIKFHTYQLKKDRSYRVVIKNLHHSTSTTDIIYEIEKMVIKFGTLSMFTVE